MNVDDITDDIIGREGGFVNDPDDPGGATNWGVTIGTLRRIRGHATVADVRALTREEAEEIFKNDFFFEPKINELPSIVQPSVFDMNVNSGENAVKILQSLMREFGEEVSVDGGLGPQSIGAANRVAKKAGLFFADAYGIARRDYYFAIADRRKASRKYARTRKGGKGGWIKRAEEFISPQYHMTTADFNKRVGKWG